MKRLFLLPAEALIALLMASWGWLTPRARFYKASAWALCILASLYLVDQAFVLPKIEGWLAMVSLVGILGVLGGMAWRWTVDESLDVPRRWLAPVESDLG